MTGVFFFILMYTGSNILPIAKFLKYTHMKQSFRPDEVLYLFAHPFPLLLPSTPLPSISPCDFYSLQQATSDIMQRSILGQLLPEAMVHFLENHGMLL